MEIKDYNLSDGTPWRLFAPKNYNKEWAVLWLQGFTSTIDGHTEGCIRMSQQSGIAFAMLNYAGHGNHPATLDGATRKQQFEEVCAVYDEVVSRGFKKIIVIGGSFGGYMAALLSGVRNPKVIVLRAPANYSDDEFEYPYNKTASSQNGRKEDLYRQSINDSYSNAATKSLSSFKGVSYIIEHGDDDIVLKNIPQSYYSSARLSSYIILPDLKHSPKLQSNKKGWFDIIEHWIETIIYTSVNYPISL